MVPGSNGRSNTQSQSNTCEKPLKKSFFKINNICSPRTTQIMWNVYLNLMVRFYLWLVSIFLFAESARFPTIQQRMKYPGWKTLNFCKIL